MRRLMRFIPQGDALPECAVETSEGPKCPMWRGFRGTLGVHESGRGELFACARDLCRNPVAFQYREEMLDTPDKPGKRELYFQAGPESFGRAMKRAACRFLIDWATSKSYLCPEFPRKV